MALDKEKKVEIVNNFKVHSSDTGSAPVQIAILTERINKLTEHFKNYPKDFSSRRGLLMLVGKRKKLLRYLEKADNKKFKEIINKLNLK